MEPSHQIKIQRLKFKNQKRAFKIRNFIFSFLILIFTFLSLISSEANAHCPLCVAGAGAGLTLSRLLGIDDSITGVWLAAFLGAISFWTFTYVEKKRKVPLAKPLIYIAIFVATLWSFYKFNLVIKMGDIFGVHKLTFGMITGGALFYLVDAVDDYLIKRNGKVFFPYQRIIVSLGSILFLSIAMFILINYYI